MSIDTATYVKQAVAAVQAKIGPIKPTLALVAGSGLGGVADLVQDPIVISYADLPGFPAPGVHGHKGQLVFGHIAGVATVVLMGRVHVYEGEESWRLKVMIRTMRELGCDYLFLTNAAGSMRLDVGPGELVMITDHINFMGSNPLMGPNEDSFGSRFVDLEDCWDPQLRELLSACAEQTGVPLHQGVFAGWMGPAFETPAEIRMLAMLGAQTVGMSTVPDCIIARHCGLRVIGVSVITNFACGLSPKKVSHELTLSEAEKGATKLLKLVEPFLRGLGQIGS
jgi:xanthosine phosphorylase